MYLGGSDSNFANNFKIFHLYYSSKWDRDGKAVHHPKSFDTLTHPKEPFYVMKKQYCLFLQVSQTYGDFGKKIDKLH